MSSIELKNFTDIAEAEKATSSVIMVNPDGQGRKVAYTDIKGVTVVAHDDTMTGTGQDDEHKLSVVTFDGAKPGLVPVPEAGKEEWVLNGQGRWVEAGGSSQSDWTELDEDRAAYIKNVPDVLRETPYDLDFNTDDFDLTEETTGEGDDEVTTVTVSFKEGKSFPVQTDGTTITGDGTADNKLTVPTFTFGTSGLVPVSTQADSARVLNGKGEWVDQAGGTVMTGATSGTAGTSGLVPKPNAGDQNKVLTGAGTWVEQGGGADWTAAEGEAGYIQNVPDAMREQVKKLTFDEDSFSQTETDDEVVISIAGDGFVTGSGITSIHKVDELPEDASEHPEILYVVNDGGGASNYITGDGITSIKRVDELPEDAGSHPDIMYIVNNGEGSGGSVLPAYTAEDEGKVLRIKNGVPSWQPMVVVATSEADLPTERDPNTFYVVVSE